MFSFFFCIHCLHYTKYLFASYDNGTSLWPSISSPYLCNVLKIPFWQKSGREKYPCVLYSPGLPSLKVCARPCSAFFLTGKCISWLFPFVLSSLNRVHCRWFGLKNIHWFIILLTILLSFILLIIIALIVTFIFLTYQL